MKNLLKLSEQKDIRSEQLFEDVIQLHNTWCNECNNVRTCIMVLSGEKLCLYCFKKIRRRV